MYGALNPCLKGGSLLGVDTVRTPEVHSFSFSFFFSAKGRPPTTIRGSAEVGVNFDSPYSDVILMFAPISAFGLVC